MNFENGDLIMFPGWRKELEDKSLEAVKLQNYEEALLHIKKLETYDAASNDILTAKVICLIELSRYDQAISLCRKLMKEDEENYYKYLHIYLTILFQTSQYSEVIDMLDEVQDMSLLPEEYQEPFQQIYDMSKQFQTTATVKDAEDHMNHFFTSLENGNFQEQWKLLSFHRKHAIQPYLKQLVPYLSDSNLNPVIKTGILQWCMDEDVTDRFQVEKFNQRDWFSPATLPDVLESDFAKASLRHLDSVEQSDATMYQFTKQILYRYLYITFPYTPDMEDAELVAESVLYLAKNYLQVNESNEQQEAPSRIHQEKMDEIEHLEKVYFSQIDD
ncbi:tetratricopeptide repeat protein [Halalkalibacillus sediminis]|nr:tetratricopeptide repeat protein [Halalkalibacillus sediminis]